MMLCLEFVDSSRVYGEREVCTNRCVVVGSLWADRGEGEGEGKGGGEGGGRGGGGEEEGERESAVGIRGK